MEENELIKVVETLLFITDEPIKTEKIAKICEVKNVKYIEEILERIKHSYDMENRALCIMRVAGGWQMATRSEYSIWVRKLYQTRLTMRLSNAALETLSIIAYKQPVTRAQIERIRGVDVMGPIDTLLERKLIAVLGRADTVGRPIIFGTTDEFLRQFGLNSLNDLPHLENMISKESIERVNSIMSSGDEAKDGELFQEDAPKNEESITEHSDGNSDLEKNESDLSKQEVNESQEKINENQAQTSDSELIETEESKEDANNA